VPEHLSGPAERSPRTKENPVTNSHVQAPGLPERLTERSRRVENMRHLSRTALDPNDRTPDRVLD